MGEVIGRIEPELMKCPDCYGSGHVDFLECWTCEGNGTVELEEEDYYG